MTSFFEGACNVNFSGSASFTSANTVVNNFNHLAGVSGSPSSRGYEQWDSLPGGIQRLRVVDMGDINLLKQLSLRTDSMINSRTLKLTNPFHKRSGIRGVVVKIRRRSQSAEIIQFGDRQFTVITYEPENEGDVEKIRTVLQPIWETALSQRQVWFPQLFGVGRATMPTLIYHDEIVCGEDILEQYWKTPIVFHYLWYKLIVSQDTLEDDITLQKSLIPFSSYRRDWTFNLRTRSFQLDIASVALFYAIEGDSRYPSSFVDRSLSLLPRPCNPSLDSSEIIRVVPNYLYLVSDLGYINIVECLTDLIRHEVLTFGAIVDRTRFGVLGYFPSIPELEVYRQSVHGPDLVVESEESVPSLLNLTFMKTTNVQLNIQFSVRLTQEYRRRLRFAYLIQSLPFFNYTADPNDLIFVDEFIFSLVGNFTSDPSSSHPPKYLHVPPLFPEWINGTLCLRWPAASPSFYWSFDRNGTTQIAEEDWEQHGIPKLRIETLWIGSSWKFTSYHAVRDFLRLKANEMDGAQFAIEHGYPLLVEFMAVPVRKISHKMSQ